MTEAEEAAATAAESQEWDTSAYQAARQAWRDDLAEEVAQLSYDSQSAVEDRYMDVFVSRFEERLDRLQREYAATEADADDNDDDDDD